MSELRYDIVFYGKIRDGFDLEQVKTNFIRLFSLTEDKVEKIFRGARVILKPDVDGDTARQFQQALTRAGAHASLEPRATSPAPPASEAPTVEEGADRSAPPVSTDSNRADGEPLRDIEFRFSGEGAEYFRVWIVNLLLTIATLGIYSAWAKVRNKQYFYGNTTLDDASFEYLANPVNILKGRLIAVAFFAVYSVAGNLVPVLGLALALLLMVFLPWLVVRSLAFNAHYSAHRNIRFNFQARVRDAAAVFIGWPLLAMLTLGILFPLAFYKQQRFMAEHHSYGTQAFAFHASARDYYALVLTAVGILIAMLVASFVLGAVFAPLAVIMMAAAYLVAFAYFSMQRLNLLYNNATLGDHGFHAALELRSYTWLVFTNTLGIALTLGLFIPWARVRSARYKAEHIRFVAADDLDNVAAIEREHVSALGEEVGEVFAFDIGL